VTIGKSDVMSVDVARDKFRHLLLRNANGEDLLAEQRNKITVEKFCEDYLRDVKEGRVLTRKGGAKSPSTIATDEGRIRSLINPLLGRLFLTEVRRSTIDDFMHSVSVGRGILSSGGKGAATRAVGLLGAIFQHALRRELISVNPVRGVVRFADKVRDRVLSATEYADLEKRLTGSKIPQSAKDAIRFICQTGWRRSEVLTLRWSMIDFEKRQACLPSTKTGKSHRVLSIQAIDFLKTLDRTKRELVFPSGDSDSPFQSFHKVWARLGLDPTITPHGLRHSYASIAANIGYSEFIVSSLIGHKLNSMTSRYVHLSSEALLGASNSVGTAIEGMMQCQS
jgi:integrase